MNYSQFVGIPWVRNGRDKLGADCLGLAILVRKEAGLNTPDYEYIDPTTEEVASIILKEECNYIELTKPKPFCLVTFTDIPPYSTHVGVVLEDCQRFIHTRSVGPKRSVIERLDHPVWQRRRTGFWEPI